MVAIYHINDVIAFLVEREADLREKAEARSRNGAHHDAYVLRLQADSWADAIDAIRDEFWGSA